MTTLNIKVIQCPLKGGSLVAHETDLGLRSSYVATCLEVTRSKLLGSSVQVSECPSFYKTLMGCWEEPEGHGRQSCVWPVGSDGRVTVVVIHCPLPSGLRSSGWKRGCLWPSRPTMALTCKPCSCS